MADSTIEIRADEWIRDNPELWEKFENHALYEAAHGRHVSVQWLIEDVRRHDRVNRIGDPCKVNNSFGPIFARRLMAKHPVLAPFIETRRSMYDESGAE